MMASRILKAGNHSRFQRIVDSTFDRLANRYERLVSGSLKYRPVTLMIVIALVSLTGFMFSRRRRASSRRKRIRARCSRSCRRRAMPPPNTR